MPQELLEGVVSGGDYDGGQPICVGGRDIGRGIADDADGSVGAALGTGLRCSMGDEVGSGYEMVAEAPKGEPMAKAEKFDLEPSDGFEIAGRHSDDGAFVAQMLENFVDSGHFVDFHFGAARGYIIAHLLEHVFEMRLPVLLIEFGNAEGVAENTGIGITAQGYGIEGEFMAHDALHARKEGLDVNAVAAAQQRAVDVKKVCVLGVPAESLALKDAGWLSFCRSHAVVLPCIQDKTGRCGRWSARELPYF